MVDNLGSFREGVVVLRIAGGFQEVKIGGRSNTKARRGREISALQRVDGHRNRVVSQAKRKRGI
jgi:hypothetical protein